MLKIFVKHENDRNFLTLFVKLRIYDEFRTGGKRSSWFPPGELVEQTAGDHTNIKNTYIYFSKKRRTSFI